MSLILTSSSNLDLILSVDRHDAILIVLVILNGLHEAVDNLGVSINNLIHLVADFVFYILAQLLHVITKPPEFSRQLAGQVREADEALGCILVQIGVLDILRKGLELRFNGKPGGPEVGQEAGVLAFFGFAHDNDTDARF